MPGVLLPALPVVPGIGRAVVVGGRACSPPQPSAWYLTGKGGGLSSLIAITPPTPQI